MTNYQINLFHRQIVSPADKIIYFALHYLRYIIVLTQIVVIAVFFARFQLDQNIIDLRERIGQKREIIKVTRPLVEQAQSISFRVDSADKYLSQQKQFLELFTLIINNVPEKIRLKDLSINKNIVNIKGISDDLKSIVLFYNKLNQDKTLREVELKSISKIESDQFEFAFTGK